MTDTFYELLGVGEDASESEIEDAYREKIKETHPDVSDDVDAAEKTKRLNKAKDVLTDEAERERYDRVGHAAYVSEDGPFADDAAAESSGGPDPSQGDPTHSTDSTAGSYGSSRRGRSGATRGSGSRDGGWTSTNREQRRRAQDGFDGFDGFGEDDSTATDRQTRREAQHKAAEEAGWTNATASGSTSSRRQAGTTDGDGSVGTSWNEWDTNRSYAVHEGSGVTDLQLVDLLPARQYLPLTTLTFVLYPILVFSSLFPRFPAVVNVVVAICTLLMVFYLLLVPEVAFTVFGFWSVITPLTLLVVPGPVFTIVGMIALLASWLPFGFAVLMVVVVRP